MTSLVSVVIPTFNRAHLILRTITSILNQTYPFLEVIIISDGATDNTREVVLSIHDSRIAFIERVNSGGCSSPRNNGMRQAKGKYIAFCDDDDVWYPTKIEEQIAILEQNHTYGACYTNMIRFDNTTEWSLPRESGPCTFNTLLYANVIPISSLVIRRELMDTIGYFNENKKVGSAEDYEYVLRIALKYPIYHLNKVLVKYWSGENRMTSDTLSFIQPIRYLLYSFYCYYSVKKEAKVSSWYFVKPTFILIYGTLKRLVYVIKQKALLVFKRSE